jgi:hypothetical protein
VAKPLFIARGLPQVRGCRPWPACFNVFMLLIGRSIGAEPKLFLENSLIKSLPDGVVV